MITKKQGEEKLGNAYYHLIWCLFSFHLLEEFVEIKTYRSIISSIYSLWLRNFIARIQEDVDVGCLRIKWRKKNILT
jgi:hypothetical protein